MCVCVCVWERKRKLGTRSIYLQLYIYIYIYIYMYMRTHTYIYIYIYTHTHTVVWINLNRLTCTCIKCKNFGYFFNVHIVSSFRERERESAGNFCIHLICHAIQVWVKWNILCKIISTKAIRCILSWVCVCVRDTGTWIKVWTRGWETNPYLRSNFILPKTTL